MEIFEQDESTDLAILRQQYANDIKFLNQVGQLLSEAEKDTYSNVINSIDKYIQLSKLFNDKKDLR